MPAASNAVKMGGSERKKTKDNGNTNNKTFGEHLRQFHKKNSV